MIGILIASVQALLFYLLPILIGRAVVRRLYSNMIPLPFITYFIAGACTLFATVLLARYTLWMIWPTLPFEAIFAGIVTVLGVASIPFNIIGGFRDIKIKPYITPVLFSLATASTIFSIWKIKSPYPFNWDMLEHQTLVDTILSGRFSFVTSQVTDTFGFNGYSTFIHTLIGASQWWYNVQAFDYWHAIGFIHLVLVTFASYLLAKVVTENKAVAYISGLLGGFIFDSSVSFTSLFFIPQTFTAVAFIFLLSQLFAYVKKGMIPTLTLVVFQSLFLFLNHYIIGTIAVSGYIATYLYCQYRIWIAQHLNRKLLFITAVILAVVAIIASAYIPLGFINSGEASSFTPTFAEKYRVMKQIYGFSLFIFFPLGVGAILRWKGEVEVLILTLTLALFSLVILQFPYVLKFYVLARFFVHLVMAIGIYSMIRLLTNRFQHILAYTLIVITFLTLFITNSASWKEILRYENTYSNISAHEVSAGEFLKERYSGQNALIISDPATQQILETISGINSQGGAYMNSASRSILHSLTQPQNQAEIANSLYEINDTVASQSGKRLFVVSGRYFLWQYSAPQDKASLSFNIWYPANLTLEDYQYIQFLNQNPTHFKQVYGNKTLAIFEVSK